MMTTGTRNILWMFVLLTLVLAGAIPVLLLIASMLGGSGTGSAGGVFAIAAGLSTWVLQMILGLIVLGVLAVGVFLFRRKTPLE